MSGRVAIVCDFAEENWSSMDLVGLMLEQGLRRFEPGLKATHLCPPMKRRLTTPQKRNSKFMFNGDRFLNRFWDYPRWLRRRRGLFDVFHIVDSSYSHLVHQLPAERTVITCHDLNTFRSILEPQRERRPVAFRAMMNYTLKGFQKAARIVCASASTKREVLKFGLIDPRHVSHVALGVHPSCTPEPDNDADAEVSRLLGPPRMFDLLNVGTTVPRKRIDVLLEVFARTLKAFPEARLIRAGGEFTDDQKALAKRLSVDDAIVSLPYLDRSLLASVYRRATVLLLPSEYEGFGLPLVEAMACGTPVIASDIDTLREVGGDAAHYCAVGDVEGWVTAVTQYFTAGFHEADQRMLVSERCLRQAAHFSWTDYTNSMVSLYSELLRS